MRVPKHGWSLILIGLMVVVYVYRSRAQGSPPTGGTESAAPSAASPALAPAPSASESAPPGAEPPEAAAAETEPEQEQEDPAVAATVNGVHMLTADLNERTQALARQHPARVPLSPAQARAIYLRNRWRVLERLIDDALRTQAVQEAEDAGQIQLNARAYEGGRQTAARQYPTETAFRDAHPFTLLTRDAYVRRAVLWSALARRLAPDARATAEEVRAFYDAHRGRWKDKNGNPLSFEQAQLQVERNLLANQRAQMIQRWLLHRRQAATVRILLPSPPSRP
jgi:hypothetical protein